MTLTRMDTTVAQAMRAAAAIAVFQEANRTQVIHLMLGLLIYSEQNQAFLRSRKVSSKPFELWHHKLQEPLLTLEDCAPEPSPELQSLLTRFVQEGRSKGLLAERNLMLHLLRDPDRRIDKYPGSPQARPPGIRRSSHEGAGGRGRPGFRGSKASLQRLRGGHECEGQGGGDAPHSRAPERHAVAAQHALPV